MALPGDAFHKTDLELANPPVTALSYRSMDEDEELSLRRLWEILGQHRLLFCGVFFSVLALGALYIFGSHKKYASTMELLVTNERSAPVVTPGRSEAPAGVEEVTEEELNSQAQVLQSRDVLDEVVDPAWDSKPISQRSKAEIQQHESALGALQKSLQVTPLRKSYLLSAQITARDPYEATSVLTKLLSVFLAKKRQLSFPAGISQMFEQQAEDYKTQWQAAQQQLSGFQQTNGIVSIADQESLLQKELLSAQTELQATEVDIAFSRDKIHGDSDQIRSTPERLTSRQTAIPDTGSVDQLHTKLNELELQRTELLTKYKANDRLVQRVNQEIAQLTKALQDSDGYRSSETSTDINPIWQAAQQDLSENTAKMSALSGRRSELQTQLDMISGKLAATEQAAEKYNTLQQRVTELDQGYQLYEQKRNEARMDEVMSEHQLLDVAVAQKPSFSTIPVSPRPLTDSALSIVTGLFLACIAVFLVHNSKTTVSTEHDLEALTGYRTLASLPSRKHLTKSQDSSRNA